MKQTKVVSTMVEKEVEQIICDSCGIEIISKYDYKMSLTFEGCRPPSTEYVQCKDEWDLCSNCQSIVKKYLGLDK